MPSYVKPSQSIDAWYRQQAELERRQRENNGLAGAWYETNKPPTATASALGDAITAASFPTDKDYTINEFRRRASEGDQRAYEMLRLYEDQQQREAVYRMYPSQPQESPEYAAWRQQYASKYYFGAVEEVDTSQPRKTKEQQAEEARVKKIRARPDFREVVVRRKIDVTDEFLS